MAELEFALRLYKSSVTGTDVENAVICPISVEANLAMLCAASKNQTKKELFEVLLLNSKDRTLADVADVFRGLQYSSDTTEEKFITANAVFADDNCAVEPTFASEISSLFDTMIRNVSFQRDLSAACAVINAFVSSATHGKIKEIYSSGELSPETSVVLINATYYRGFWDYPFNPTETRVRPFVRLDGTTKMIPFMINRDLHQKHDICPICLPTRIPGENPIDFRQRRIDNSLRVIILPQTVCEFLFILPPKCMSLSEFEASLTPAKILDMARISGRSHAELELPKFRLDVTIDLMPVFKDMGLHTLCGHADLSGMLPDLPALDLGAKQKCFLEIDELGATAAAVTAVDL